MVCWRSLLIAAALLVFSLLYLGQVGLSNLHYKSMFLLVGLLVSLVASLAFAFRPDETLVVGLLFAVPLADRLISLPSLWGRAVGDLVLYFVIPLLLFLTIGRERWRQLRSIGLSLGERRTTLRMTVTLLLLASLMAFAGLFSPSMTRYYPIWSTGGEVSVAEFAYNEFLFAVIMFSGEFFYRGLVLLTLGRRSFWGAIVLQSIPYAFLHLGKPAIEVPYSFVAGLVFGWANLRSRSLLPSWLTHFMGSALFDALVLLT